MPMWYPHTWSDIEALIGHAQESSTLDFKVELGSSPDIAKDLAAMALNGGVLVYGVAEDKTAGVAHEIKPIALTQVEERLHQIAGSGIAPPVDLDVLRIRQTPDASTGVVVAVVPTSPLAPHQVNYRYPFRRGTTTDYLEERDVERLYQQRAELTDTENVGELLEHDFVAMLLSERDLGFGYLDLLVKPGAASASHPAGAWQRQDLEDAVRRAGARQSARLPGIRQIRSLDALSRWQPWQATGWTAGGFSDKQSPYVPEAEFGASLVYPARLSFQARWSLIIRDDEGQERYRSARETTVAADLTGMLAIAGEYFATFPYGGLLFAALRLRGFQGAQSQGLTERRPEAQPVGNGAPSGITRELQVNALDLRDEPDATAEQLIERWLPSFVSGTNVLGPLRSAPIPH